MMQARDASGRCVSLLNDEGNNTGASAPVGLTAQRPLPPRPLSYRSNHAPSRPTALSRSTSSSPHMPELSRSESFDSQVSNDPLSPLTPATDYAFPRPAQYPINQAYAVDPAVAKRPAFAQSRTTSYVGESPPATSPLPEQRQGKRYPCRYRETHGCEKTFTTSGHASRHSKIHTAEKAVQCSFPLCQKKFTRADNMKQHLETHFKDRARGAASAQRAQQRMAARNRPVARESQASTARPWEPTEQRPLPTPPLASPSGTGATWDMNGLNLPLLSRPVAARTPSSGLDALAMAIAHQEEVA